MEEVNPRPTLSFLGRRCHRRAAPAAGSAPTSQARCGASRLSAPARLWATQSQPGMGGDEWPGRLGSGLGSSCRPTNRPGPLPAARFQVPLFPLSVPLPVLLVSLFSRVLAVCTQHLASPAQPVQPARLYLTVLLLHLRFLCTSRLHPSGPLFHFSPIPGPLRAAAPCRSRPLFFAALLCPLCPQIIHHSFPLTKVSWGPARPSRPRRVPSASRSHPPTP
jgi:hypothetical protein